MGDVKESALSTANDFAYVRALDSNGNSIRISKADLTSVLEGLLPVANINNRGLMDKGTISSILVKVAGVQQQLTIIKATESSPYYGAIVAVYKGGINDLYAITTSSNTVYIKKLSANDNANSYDFYLNSSRDLIVKGSVK